MRTDFKNRNIDEWKSRLSTLFPNGIPDYYEWANPVDIVKVLNILGDNVCHLLYPDSGGFDFISAKSSWEVGCINLNTQGIINVLVPKVLRFHSIKGVDEAAYFRLETKPLNESGIYEKINGYTEELLHIARTNEYVDRRYFESGYYLDKNGFSGEVTSDDLLCYRILKGSILLVAKSCEYNRIPKTYCGFHNKFNHEIFYEVVKKIYDKTK